MCLTDIKQTETTYTATVDGKTYTVDISSFPKGEAIAMAIEVIRSKAYPPKTKSPEPAAFDTTKKANA